MSDSLKKHYKKLLEENGPSPAAVQHINKDSQFKRFEILTGIDSNLNSVVDVGCGLGDMCDFFIENGMNVKYLGLDFLSDFIKIANSKYKEYENFKFDVSDLSSDEIPTGYDYVLLSGVFNNVMENNQKFMINTIEKMFKACQKGIAFNAMSTYVDYESKELFYSNPLEIFDYCKKNITRKVVLKHDYILKEGSIPFEYTMFLYKG